MILIILSIPNCRADKCRQQDATLSFQRLYGVCCEILSSNGLLESGPLQAIALLCNACCE